MAGEAIDGLPGAAVVLAAEEAGRLGAGVDHARLAFVARADVPDVEDCGAEVGREAEALAAPVPGLAHVVALRHGAPPRPVVRGGVEAGGAAAQVGCQVEEGPAGQRGFLDLPPLALRIAAVDEA